MNERPKSDPDMSDPAVREVMTAFGIDKPEIGKSGESVSPTEIPPVIDPEIVKRELETREDEERKISDEKARELSEKLHHPETYEDIYTDSYESSGDEDSITPYRTPKRRPFLGFLGFLGVAVGIGVAKVGKKVYQAPSSIFATIEDWGKEKMEKNWPFLKKVPFIGKWLLSPVEKSLSEEEVEAEKKKDPKKAETEKKKKTEAEKKKNEKIAKEKNTAMVKEAREKAKAEGKTLTEKKKIRDGLDKQLEKAGIPEEERGQLLEEWDEMIKEEELKKNDEESKKAA